VIVASDMDFAVESRVSTPRAPGPSYFRSGSRDLTTRESQIERSSGRPAQLRDDGGEDRRPEPERETSPEAIGVEAERVGDQLSDRLLGERSRGRGRLR